MHSRGEITRYRYPPKLKKIEKPEHFENENSGR